jgi:hypothetical protein
LPIHIVAALILESDQSANTSNPTPNRGYFMYRRVQTIAAGNFGRSISRSAIRSRDGVDSE